MNRIALISYLSIVLVSCGGSGSKPSLQPGYYRGTLSLIAHGDYFPGGTEEVVADVQANGDLRAYAWGPLYACLFTKTGTESLFVGQTTTFSGSIDENIKANRVDFSVLTSDSDVFVTGTLMRKEMPTLGAQVSVPAAGNYEGDTIIVNEGHVAQFASVEATVDGAGNFHAVTVGGGSWLGTNSHLTGKFEPGGTLSDSLIQTVLYTINQETPPVYSYDGVKIIVRYDYLALSPGSGWITLTRK